MAATLGMALVALASSELLPPTRIANVVEVREVSGDAGSVSGRLVNLSDRAVSNVRLSVNDTFMWTDERHPGVDDPSHAAAFTLAQEIPPNGSAPFTVRRTKALPARSDGRFQTSVEVTGVTEKPAQPSTY